MLSKSTVFAFYLRWEVFEKWEIEDVYIYLFQYSRKVPSYSWQAYIAHLRYSPAYSVTDGILKSQVRLLIQCFVHNKVMSIIEKHNASCCLQHDGLKLKPALEYCRHHLLVIGLSSGPMAYEEIE